MNRRTKWEVNLNNLKSVEIFQMPLKCLTKKKSSDSSSGPMNSFCVGGEMAHSNSFGSIHLVMLFAHCCLDLCCKPEALATPGTAK